MGRSKVARLPTHGRAMSSAATASRSGCGSSIGDGRVTVHSLVTRLTGALSWPFPRRLSSVSSRRRSVQEDSSLLQESRILGRLEVVDRPPDLQLDLEYAFDGLRRLGRQPQRFPGVPGGGRGLLLERLQTTLEDTVDGTFDDTFDVAFDDTLDDTRDP